jgi:hypothetical protein
MFFFIAFVLIWKERINDWCCRNNFEDHSGQNNFNEFQEKKNLVVKVDLEACKPYTFLESASNLLPEKVLYQYHFVGQP